MPRRHSTAYTVGFAAVICLVCAVAVSSLSVALKPRQDANRELDRQKNVLIAARLLDPSSDAGDGEIAAAFRQRVTAAATPEGLTVYEVREDGRLDMVVLPVEGKGLWSTLYGFLALDADTTTIRGLAFYQHGETPGLGGEVENPKWTALWVGRKAYDERWRPAIEVVKGQAGAPAEDPHRVDGLSGATITSNGVSRLIERWLGDEGYGPYLAEVRKGRGE